MIYKSSYRDTGSPAQQTAVRTPGKSSGVGANIGGIIGGTIGQIVGTPADAVAGPGGTMAGGAIGGGIGGGAGEIVDELLHGSNPLSSGAINNAKADIKSAVPSMKDPLGLMGIPKVAGDLLGLDKGKVARAAGSQAAYGAIPGGDEVRALPLIGRVGSNIVGRAALRAGTGAAGNAAAQQIENGKIDPKQAILAGGANAVVPGAAKILRAPANTVSRIAGRAIKSGQSALEAASNEGIGSLAHILGNNLQELNNGKIMVTPAWQRLNEEGKLNLFKKDSEGNFLPSENLNLGELKGKLKDLAQNTEAKLTPMLEKVTINTNDNLKPIIKQSLKDNYDITYGSRANGSKAAKADAAVLDHLPRQLKNLFTAPNQDMSLGELRELGKKLNNFIDRTAEDKPATQKDRFLESVRSGINDEIQAKLNEPGNETFAQVMADHGEIANAKNNLAKFKGSSKTLPGNLSPVLRDETSSGLRKGRLIELAARGGVGALPLAGLLVPGMPPEVKAALLALTGLLTTSEVGPRVFPEAGIKAGTALQNATSKNLNLDKILQQMGVRL